MHAAHKLPLPAMRGKKKTIVLENVLVEDYAAEGKALARVDGKVVFIENAVPGDVVDVQLFKNKKDWAEGRAINFKQLSKERVTPFCQHFGVCGGSQWQMLPYQKQTHYKFKQVAEQLRRIGHVQLPEIMPIAGADETRRYRNKLEYTFSEKKFFAREEYAMQQVEGYVPPKGAAGFHAKGMFDKVVDIVECHLQNEPTNAIRNAVREYAFANDLTFYNFRQHTGYLRNMQVRLATTGELMVNLIVGYEDEPVRVKLLEFLKSTFPQITTLMYTINEKNNDSMFGLTPVAYTGTGYITEKLEDFIFKISPASFFQTNTKQGEKLYTITRDFAELTGTQTVYDLYCGTGSIGIFCSKGARKLIGVEMVEAAIVDAKENAKLNNIEHSRFFAGDVIKICDDAFFEKHGRPDVIITDPPRAGMHEKLIQKLLEIEAPLVVYVSCNPATQARDLGLLNEKYSVEKIQPVDMFPHTHHIENVVQLKLRNNNEI